MVDVQPAACSASGGTPLNQRSTRLVLLDDEAAVQRKCGSTIARSEECVSSKVAAGRGVNAEAVAGPGLGRPPQTVHTCFPERMRSLPNGDFHAGHIHVLMQARLELSLGGSLEKELDRLLEIVSSLFDRAALAGDIQFRAERDIRRPVAFDDRGKLPLHDAYSDRIPCVGTADTSVPVDTRYH